MAIGEVVLGAFLQVLLEKLASGALARIMKHVKGVKINDKTIRNLEKSLRLVAALLRDAEQQQHRMQKIMEVYKLWVEDLQDVAYDLEDILDELATDAHLLQLQQADDDDDSGGSKGRNTTCFQSAKTKVKNIVACGSGAMQCFQYPGSGDLPSKIKDISSRLQESHIHGRNRLGLSDLIVRQPETHPSIMQKSWRDTTSLISERIIYGREEKKNKIVQMLLNHEEPSTENFDVIPIVGTGGMGKTTLAQYVYNDPQLKGHFALKAWVCVSDDEFDSFRVTRDIINSALGENLTFSNLDQAQNKLAEEVKDKRFLIVLDDVWTEQCDDWDQLKTPFLHGARGSKVIVTTRKSDSAKMMSTNRTHNIIHLEKLSDPDCWHLFKRHADLKSDNELAEMKDDIIRKCDGLPLAAKALGGLFKKKKEKSQRQSLLESGIWREESRVLPVLRLSYFHLPYYLKRIFAYCSIFPKDYEFEETEIILFWMAQGMLPEHRENSMEVIGHLCLLELVSSSLFERSPSDEELYVMHDLVHDLSQWAAGDLCRCVMDTKALEGNPARTRHLNLHTNDTNVTNHVNQHTSPHQLRTFICEWDGYVDRLNLRDFISQLRSIRTLFLVSTTIEELPEHIGDLKLLRYLRLDFPNLTELPQSIGKLCSLQTLFLDCCKTLRWSEDLRFLVTLRHLSLSDSLWESKPVGIGKLTELKKLGERMILVDDHERGCLIRELRDLNRLHGKLSITGLENVRNVEDAREAQLHKKEDLERLSLKWLVDDDTEGEDEVDDDNEGEDEVDDDTKGKVLAELKPNSGIKVFKLKGYSGLTLPSWLADPAFENMVDIKLKNCEKCEQLPPLGQLPSLKKLWVEGMESLRCFHDNIMEKFPCLEELVIKGCESFQGTLPPLLPCLKILRIKNCRQAKVSLPSSPKFEVLKIDSCEELMSSMNIVVIQCSKKMHLKNIKSDFTGLQVDGPCREGLVIRECDSLKSVEKIPVAAEEVRVQCCGKLERVEWEEASTSSASNNNRVSIQIWGCPSVVHVANIPLSVANLEIGCCGSLEYVMFGGKWNLFKSSEATDRDTNGPPLLLNCSLLSSFT